VQCLFSELGLAFLCFLCVCITCGVLCESNRVFWFGSERLLVARRFCFRRSVLGYGLGLGLGIWFLQTSGFLTWCKLLILKTCDSFDDVLLGLLKGTIQDAGLLH